MISEYAENTFIDEKLTLDGKETPFKSPFGNSPGMISAHRSEKGDSLFIDSKVIFKNGGRTNEWNTNEIWTLQNNGKSLLISRSTTTNRGKGLITAVFDKL